MYNYQEKNKLTVYQRPKIGVFKPCLQLNSTCPLDQSLKQSSTYIQEFPIRNS